MAWQPGQRAAQLALQTPLEDVPNHLKVPLWAWVHPFLNATADYVRIAGLRLQVTLGSVSSRSGHLNAMEQLRVKCMEDAALLLDLVEFTLQMHCANDWNYGPTFAKDLDVALQLGNSAYKVRADRAGLELRTTPEVQTQVQAVVDTATGSARQHLANAWNEAYALHPDPVKAYSESVKAVEAAVHGIISPKNATATLGSMIAAVNNKPEDWAFVIEGHAHPVDGVAIMLDMMRLLQKGQTSRHGGSDPTREETLEEARAAVHLAATLVQYSVSGAFSKV